MIHFSHVYKIYGQTPALRDINLKIEKGDFVFVTGPSGAGKSTLFRLISAFEKTSSGSLNVAGYNMDTIANSRVPFLRRQIGVVFQDFRLLKDRSVFENVALPLQILGEKPAFISRRVHEVLETVGLRYKSDDLPSTLSGGEQQRVAIARAIVHRPEILIADEPTGNLDHELSVQIMKVLESVNAQGTTVFVATHDRKIVEQFHHRVIKIRNGQIEETNTHAHP
jgi:cell division transport system ATP-binding protein